MTKCDRFFDCCLIVVVEGGFRWVSGDVGFRWAWGLWGPVNLVLFVGSVTGLKHWSDDKIVFCNRSFVYLLWSRDVFEPLTASRYR